MDRQPDSRTYVHLILYGPEVEDPENPDLREKITELGKRASLVIADSYETEQMGVLAETSIGIMVERERLALIRNLTQASGLLLQLEATVSDVREGVESLESVINPENH